MSMTLRPYEHTEHAKQENEVGHGMQRYHRCQDRGRRGKEKV